MAVKKPDTVSETIEIEVPDAVGKTEDVSAIEKTVAKSAAKQKVEDVNFCVYLGPTIHGVIQSGTIYSGNRKTTGKTLATAIEKYPLIAKLVVTDKTLAEDRVKVKTAGNALNVYFNKLDSGKSM